MLFNRKILYAGKSEFGSYRVIDMMQHGRPARMLYGSNDSSQSGMARDDDPELLFDYNQRFLEIAKSIDPSNILVIGGGAFMFPLAAHALFPNATIDVVEIDALVVELGRQFFDVPDDPRLRIFVDDGARFLESTLQTYDLIIFDAFSGYDIPAHLLESHTIEIAKHALKKRGVIAINFISEYKKRRRLAHEIIETSSRHFSHQTLFQSDPDHRAGDEQNYVLAASNTELQLDYVQSWPVTFRD